MGLLSIPGSEPPVTAWTHDPHLAASSYFECDPRPVPPAPARRSRRGGAQNSWSWIDMKTNLPHPEQPTHARILCRHSLSLGVVGRGRGWLMVCFSLRPARWTAIPVVCWNRNVWYQWPRGDKEALSNLVERTGMSQTAQWQLQRQRRLIPIAHLGVGLPNEKQFQKKENWM